jgi:hypothetical protein
VAVALALAAGSAEGSYEIYRLWSRGQPLAALRDINIDAITAWHFQGLRLDGLPRCLWYVPQHSMSYGLGLVALTPVAVVGSAGSVTLIVLCGLALAGATMLNPFVGGVFAVAWGLAAAIDALSRPNPVTGVLRHVLAAIPVALALAWCSAAHMVDGAGDTLAFGFWGPPAYSTVTVLMLSLGPVLVPAVAGAFARADVPIRRLLPSLALVILALGIMHLVRLRVDTAWVPFRAGQMLLVTIPAIVARGLAALNRSSMKFAGVALVAILFAIGTPTTIIDARNAQDVDDLDDGPGFHWTLVLDHDEEKALRWIQTKTPPNALVQMEPMIRDRDAHPGGWGERWSLIPSFAKSAVVRAAFQSLDAHEAWTIARRLHIAYYYVDALDRKTYAGTAKFDRSPELFTPVFRAGEVAVYAVK